jgi:hypothetical protein
MGVFTGYFLLKCFWIQYPGLSTVMLGQIGNSDTTVLFHFKLTEKSLKLLFEFLNL